MGLDIVFTLDFTVILVDGERVKGSISGTSYQDFFWEMLQKGWGVKTGEVSYRLISPYQIKEIVWDRKKEGG